MAATVFELIEQAPKEAPALKAPNLQSMRFGELLDQQIYVAETLTRAGIGRSDRVAIVLPNGPQMASAFLTIACAAIVAPLNPKYTEVEVEALLSGMNAKALVVLTGGGHAARNAAETLGTIVIELEPDCQTAGQFLLNTAPLKVTESEASAAQYARPDPNDIALVLHTSGTTGRPKIVPLTHANLAASAQNIAQTLSLTAADTCLNIMPLFHIHGLVGAVLSSIAAGGSVSCTSGFDAFEFMQWFEEEKPTWITAVPTMLYSLIGVASTERNAIARGQLRFIRSSSAPLPLYVLNELERIFKVPVIEAFGMTEASHQVTSNPLPPAKRIPGTVGIAAGLEICTFDEHNNPTQLGVPGEIGIRGANVMDAYENAPEANECAFHDGWFLTGDQGIIDADGYLRLTGRLKEMINRGGEKVAPLEVDNVLLSHDRVLQAVTFSIPNELLGEEVAAAIVLSEGPVLNEFELIEFAGQFLAPYKIPSRYFFVAEIPKGHTGKLVRTGLAGLLGLN